MKCSRRRRRWSIQQAGRQAYGRTLNVGRRKQVTKTSSRRQTQALQANTLLLQNSVFRIPISSSLPYYYLPTSPRYDYLLQYPVVVLAVALAAVATRARRSAHLTPSGLILYLKPYRAYAVVVAPLAYFLLLRAVALAVVIFQAKVVLCRRKKRTNLVISNSTTTFYSRHSSIRESLVKLSRIYTVKKSSVVSSRSLVINNSAKVKTCSVRMSSVSNSSTQTLASLVDTSIIRYFNRISTQALP